MNRHDSMDLRLFGDWENVAWKLLLVIVLKLQIWATQFLLSRNLLLMASPCNLNDFIQYLYTLVNGMNSNCMHLSFLSIYSCILSLNADRNLTGFKENCVHVSLTAFSYCRQGDAGLALKLICNLNDLGLQDWALYLKKKDRSSLQKVFIYSKV